MQTHFYFKEARTVSSRRGSTRHGQLWADSNKKIYCYSQDNMLRDTDGSRDIGVAKRADLVRIVTLLKNEGYAAVSSYGEYLDLLDLSKDSYIRAFEAEYDYDSIDVADYQSDYVTEQISISIENALSEGACPSDLEKAEIVRVALQSVQYGFTSDPEDTRKAEADFHKRFPDGR